MEALPFYVCCAVRSSHVLRYRMRLSQADKPTELTTPNQIVLSGPTPNLFFQNGRISGIHPRPVELSPRLQLPTKIFFFIRVKHARVSWPFPPSLSPEQYLHKAEIIPGHEEAGPVAHVPFDSAHVIGLYNHELLSFVQLVLEVPSTASINPTIHPTRLSFHPRHGAQLHCGTGGAGTIEMPRVIVTIYPHLISRGASRAISAPPRTDGKEDAPRRGGAAASPFRASVQKSLQSMQRLQLPAPSDVSVKDGASALTGSARSGSMRSESVRSAGAHGSARGSATSQEAPPPVPPLPIELMHSIGSAYRSKARTKQSKSGSTSKLDASRSDVDEQGWARVAIALTARAQSRPFPLSKPGPARPIPDILLQNMAVSVASARRLTRAKKGLDYIKAVGMVVSRTMDGFILTAAEKRQLREASSMELEVSKMEAEEAAAAEQAVHEAADPAQQSMRLSSIPLLGNGTVEEMSAETKAALDAVAKDGSTPSAEAFGNLFPPELAAAAALAVGAAGSAAPATASIAQDAFASAVESAVSKGAAAPSGTQSSRRSKTGASSHAASGKGGGERADGALSSRHRSASPRAARSKDIAPPDVIARAAGTPMSARGKASARGAGASPAATSAASKSHALPSKAAKKAVSGGKNVPPLPIAVPS